MSGYTVIVLPPAKNRFVDDETLGILLFQRWKERGWVSVKGGTCKVVRIIRKETIIDPQTRREFCIPACVSLQFKKKGASETEIVSLAEFPSWVREMTGK